VDGLRVDLQSLKDKHLNNFSASNALTPEVCEAECP